MNPLQPLRKHSRVVAALNLFAFICWTLQTSAADFYKSGANLDLDAAGSYAENQAPGPADILVFSNQFTSNSTFNVRTAAGTLTTGGLRFLNNMGGTVTIQPGNNVANTIALGAGGIDMLLANQNVTFNSTQGTGVLTTSLTAPQQWVVGPGRTLTMNAAVTTGGNALTLQGAGTTVIGAITGGGNLIISGLPGGHRRDCHTERKRVWARPLCPAEHN
jgi:hypothetical protein